MYGRTYLATLLLATSARVGEGFAIIHPTIRSSIATSSAATTTALNAGVGLYYSTSTGNTETVADYIAKAAGLEKREIDMAKDDEILACDALIVGAPTWNTGADEQRSGTGWDTWLYANLPQIDLRDKKVAIFGCGDQQSYGDHFCDAAGELFDLFAAKGCKVYGMTSQEGYDHTESKAVVDGKFCGLLCDEDNQYELSEGRAKAWVAQLKEEGFM